MNLALKIILIILGVVIVVGAVAYSYAMNSSAVLRKPAVYLYPEEDMRISVKLEVNGKVIASDPAYLDGWDVFVTKDSKIDGEHNYLFYEAALKKIELPDRGFVVAYSDLERWFDVYLVKLGLNEIEISDFKEYWLEELPYSDFYEIRLLSDEFLKENMNLIVYPEPDTLIRVNLYFKPVHGMLALAEPNIATPERKGFVVSEWGGILGT